MLGVTTFPPVSGVDSDNYYNKTEVELLIASGGAGGTIDLSNYYKKLETYSKEQVDALISSGTGDLSDYYTKAEVESLIANNNIDLSNYYNKTEVDGKENEIYAELAFEIDEVDTKLSAKVDKIANASLVADTKVVSYDSHIASASNPHNTTASQVGAYSKTEVDNLLANIDVSGVSLDNYYSKTQTETLLSNKVDKEAGKGLSTNDFTDAFKQALEANKVEDISTDSVNKKLVVIYTNGTSVDLNLDDIITDVKVEGAVLDATTNTLTIVNSEGGADVVIDLSLFVTTQTLNNALVGKADAIHSHTASDIAGLDIDISNKVTKNEAIVGDTKTKITYDSKGLVVSGADLSASDIPNLPQSKIINLETNLSSKVDKGVGVVGATRTKITYNNDGLITGGADLEEIDLPEISQAKITNLEADLSDKQSKLVSGTNIKTINGQSVLGSGNIEITGGSGGDVDLTDYYKKTETYSKVEVDTKISDIPPIDLSGYYNKTEVDTKIADIPSADLTNYYTKQDTDSLLDTKQDTLVSGTSIKTINGQSVLGNGNIFVTAEADLSNYYTKPQVDEFINDINVELGSMVILGAYGLRWNQETDVYEALGSVNRRQIQGNMKRCVLKDDGTVNYYLNPTNSTQKAQGGTAVLTGADGNVMVEVPKFWYKHTLVGDTHEWWVSNTPLEGYSVHPWFLEGGVERSFRYYRAYIPTVVAGKLRSISGSTPTRNQTRSSFRNLARANGEGWGLCSWNAINAIQLLFLTEYCTFNTQAVLGTGNDTGSDYGITTGQSNSIGNASSGATNNDMWMSYRGIENWYGDVWEFVDGINVQDYKVYLNQNPDTFADDVFTGDYIDSGVTIPANMSASYIKKITGNFLPTAVGGSSSTYTTDGGWSNTGNRIAFFGGAASNGALVGAFCLSVYNAASHVSVGLGAGLSR